MDSDLIGIIVIASIVFLIAGGIGSCTVITNYQDNKAITEIVQKGNDPIKARCAVKGDPVTVCAIIAK